MKIVDKIIGVSERLFMTYGVKSISMDDIASELGMSKKTIYKYVDTKEKLIRITLMQYLRADKKTVTKICEESENAVQEFILLGKHTMSMLRKLKPTLIFDLKKYHAKNWKLVEEHHFQFIHEIIFQNISRGISEGLYRDNLNIDIIAKLYMSKSIKISDDQTFPLYKYPRDVLFKEHLLYHLYGILSDKGLETLNKYEINAL